MSIGYPAVTAVGGILPGALLDRIGNGDTTLPGSDPAGYGLQPGESVRRNANRAFAYLREQWADYTRHRDRAADPASARLTRERWLLVLLRELGYPGIQALPAGITVDDKPFPVSHRWEQVPVHLLGWGTDLDHRTPGLKGAATAPHSLVQQLLNRTDDYLWAVLSNGRQLRLLRDSTTLAGAAYLEFDLEAIFTGELFPDFVVLYRTAHASRLAIRDPQAGPASCYLEAWRAAGAVQGERALDQLRNGVEQAVEILGTGLLTHPDNPHLRKRIDVDYSPADFQRGLLRLIYRLLFWFVIEDRDVLLDPDAEPDARKRYDTYFSARRLRDLALRRRHSHHGDLWDQVCLIFDILGDEKGRPQLGLPGLGGLFEPGPLDEPLANARLTNTALLQAVEALAVLPGRGTTGRQRVDFRHLGSEELGSIYQTFLELRARWDPAARHFHLETLPGNERKTTGSYYTPVTLVEHLLDTALDPLLDEATALPTRDERVQALLNLTVCDPACGSGHFLIAAARRIAKRLAAEQTDDPEPTPDALRAATHSVIALCIHGVDVNDMAAELAKVSLWLEAMQPGRPLSYLDTNIRVGNSLLGATPRLLADGIPQAAFTVLTGDDGAITNDIRKTNALEGRGSYTLFTAGVLVSNTSLAIATEAIRRADPHTLADVHIQARRAADLENSPERRRLRAVADAWCAAFVQEKTPTTWHNAITQGKLEALSHPDLARDLAATEALVEKEARRYRFFHWHQEFPHIFRVPDSGPADTPTGWVGGFSCVLGNPPWERIKLQEQEFFAARDEKIAKAANAAARKKRIAALATSDDPAERALHDEFQAALREADGVSHLLRDTGRYPLTGRGDINTFSVFAETARTILSPRGQLGIIVPTGIATDATTQDFFKDLVIRANLVALHDFENEDRVFPAVHHSMRFALLTASGLDRRVPRASLAFRARQASQIPARAYTLTPDEITLLNPNTGTCPVFTSRRDAELTLAIYRRVPLLWREGDPDGNPWGLSFMAMLHMSNDSGSFRTADQLTNDGWTLAGNVFTRGKERMLPLYEAKMIHHYDHRLGTYQDQTEAQARMGTLPRLDDADHDDPAALPLPRYWVAATQVEDRLANRWNQPWLSGWRKITNSGNERTLVTAAVPKVAAGDAINLLLPAHSPEPALTVNMSTFVLDFVTRQKLSGTNLVHMYAKQLPVLTPSIYEVRAPWDTAADTLFGWVAPRALELTYTAYDMAGYARELGDEGAPFRWVPERREVIRAELDAAYFHLYGVERDDVDYIMDTFKVVRDKDMARHGEYRTKRLILERYDALAAAARTGKAYVSPLDPPPGHGPRHPATPPGMDA